MFDLAIPSAEYTLRWPRRVFFAEARALLDAYRDGDPDDRGSRFDDAARLLMHHAFVGDVPSADLVRGRAPEAWLLQVGLAHGQVSVAPSPVVYLDFLAGVADRMPEQQHRAYWHALRDPGRRVRDDWAVLVDELRRDGFLDRAADPDCPLEDFADTQDQRLNALTAARYWRTTHCPGS